MFGERGRRDENAFKIATAAAVAVTFDLLRLQPFIAKAAPLRRSLNG